MASEASFGLGANRDFSAPHPNQVVPNLSGIVEGLEQCGVLVVKRIIQKVFGAREAGRDERPPQASGLCAYQRRFTFWQILINSAILRLAKIQADPGSKEAS